MRVSVMDVRVVRMAVSQRRVGMLVNMRLGTVPSVGMLVAMMLLSIVMAAIYGVWFGLQLTYAFTEDDMRAQEQSRTAMGEMVELIRTARLPEVAPWEFLRATIVYADSTSILFWSDADRHDNHDLELVRYRVNTANRTLYRDTWDVSGTTIVAGSSVRLVGQWVSNSDSLPLFSYADANGEELSSPVSSPMNIRTISIGLRVDIVTDKAPIAHELTSVVQPRNLR